MLDKESCRQLTAHQQASRQAVEAAAQHNGRDKTITKANKPAPTREDSVMTNRTKEIKKVRKPKQRNIMQGTEPARTAVLTNNAVSGLRLKNLINQDRREARLLIGCCSGRHR